MAEIKRYSDEDLEEFRAIINEKLALAKRDYNQMMRTTRLPLTKYWKRVAPRKARKN